MESPPAGGLVGGTVTSVGSVAPVEFEEPPPSNEIESDAAPEATGEEALTAAAPTAVVAAACGAGAQATLFNQYNPT